MFILFISIITSSSSSSSSGSSSSSSIRSSISQGITPAIDRQFSIAAIYTYTPLIQNTLYIVLIRHCKHLLVVVYKLLSRTMASLRASAVNFYHDMINDKELLLLLIYI